MQTEISDYESAYKYDPKWCEAILELFNLATKVEHFFKMFGIA